MKKILSLITIVLLLGCGSKTISNEYEHKFTDSNGNEQKVYVDITLENGKITEIDIDETYIKDGKMTTKKTLGDDYGMAAASKVGEWDDQIEYLEDKLIGTDGKIKLDDKGYPTETDVTSGCTIRLGDIQEAILQAVKTAK